MSRVGVATGLMVGGLALVVAGSPATSSATTVPRSVSILGDSTLMGLLGRPEYVDTLRQHYSNLFFDGESCKRLIQPSCRGRTGQVPVTILNTMKASRGQLGSVLVIMSGYDDSRVDDAVEAITAEARSQGVQRVLWLTYVEDVSYVGPGGITFAAVFRSHNQTLRDELIDHPELDLADWNAYSSGHPDWFGSDGIHLAQPTGPPHLVQFLEQSIDALFPVLDACATPPVPPPVTTAAPTPTPAGFVPVTPMRILDTRSEPDPGSRLPLDRAGAVPAGATAAVVNLTAVENQCAQDFLTAAPCGTGVPDASNLNVTRRRTVANLAVVALGEQKGACVYHGPGTAIVVDLLGWLVPGAPGYTPATPARIVDTRLGRGPTAPTRTRLVAAAWTPLPLDGVVGSTAKSLLANLTVVNPAAAGYLSIAPCGTGEPPVSSVNFQPGQVAANLTVVSLGVSPTCLYASATTDVLVDLVGTFGPGGYGLAATQPVRLLDTRLGVGGPAGALTRGGTRSFALPAPGALVNITADLAQSPGFLVASACGTLPDVSTLNYTPGRPVANLAVVRTDNGQECVYASQATHVIVDRLADLVG
ncbi:MAG: hypothetical protein QOD72_101 [Acidimicrobiaceae bacterium]|jgi:hypothetical protein|nr:hypothetical protein [Acidimicrobiaceae bacterium]